MNKIEKLGRKNYIEIGRVVIYNNARLDENWNHGLVGVITGLSDRVGGSSGEVVGAKANITQLNGKGYYWSMGASYTDSFRITSEMDLSTNTRYCEQCSMVRQVEGRDITWKEHSFRLMPSFASCGHPASSLITMYRKIIDTAADAGVKLKLELSPATLEAIELERKDYPPPSKKREEGVEVPEPERLSFFEAIRAMQFDSNETGDEED